MQRWRQPFSRGVVASRFTIARAAAHTWRSEVISKEMLVKIPVMEPNGTTCVETSTREDSSMDMAYYALSISAVVAALFNAFGVW